MKIHKAVSKRIRKTGESVNLTGDVNAVVVVNDGEEASTASVTSRQRIVQRSGRTVVSEQETSEPEDR